MSECFTEKDSYKLKRWIAIFRNIISGYDSLCRLSNEEKQAIPYVIYSKEKLANVYISQFTFFDLKEK